MRKIQLRNENYKYDPASSGPKERHSTRKAETLLARKETLLEGIKDKSQSDISCQEIIHKAFETESIFDCVEFDFHAPN